MVDDKSVKVKKTKRLLQDREVGRKAAASPAGGQNTLDDDLCYIGISRLNVFINHGT